MEDENFMKAVLVDGYIDEPAAFGVSPYISPKIRLLAGILFRAGYEVEYHTIDDVRKKELWEAFRGHQILVVHGGITTPGRYVGGNPVTLNDIKKLLSGNKEPQKIICGPIALGYSLKGGTKAMNVELSEVDALLSHELQLADFLGLELKGSRYEILNELYPIGARIVPQHPRYPDVMIEFDISSGCERSDGYCSFCTESLLYGKFESRDLRGIERELRALKDVGVKALRFGRSANVVAYGYNRDVGKPDPEAVENLFRLATEILKPEVLHIDNGNPIFIAQYPEESRKILETIARYDTPGDIISFGVESFDETVRRLNNLGGSAEDILKAIEIVNEIGAFRVDGVPKLLPGINLLYGLPGHSKETFKIDRAYLKKIYDNDWLIRRLNIRQVMIFEGTPLSHQVLPKFSKKAFIKHKETIRKEFDTPMLKKVFPVGAILRKVIPEYTQGDITFGRPLGTYPILVGSPVKFESPTDMVVIGHGIRSITAIPVNADLNTLSLRELTFLPGIGKNRATMLVLNRPFKNWEELVNLLEQETVNNLKKLRLQIGGKTDCLKSR